MPHESIIKTVDESIEELCKEFRAYPTLFYTENDIVCFFYGLLQQSLPILKCKDKDGFENFLVHREYPTPFRCDMSGIKFEIKRDGERTPKGGLYQRGHYDIVVLNPEFIGRYSYGLLKAQNYAGFTEQVVNRPEKDSPIILYAVEFMYSRDSLGFSRGSDRESAVDQFVAKVKQDATKLVKSRELAGFMEHIKMLAFVKGSSDEVCRLIAEKLRGRSEVRLCFAS